MLSEEREPLLSSTSSTTHKDLVESNPKDDLETSTTPAAGTSRSTEDDVLPEASTLGRTLRWRSAFILIISRVIGSGIFATPGIIVRDAGSVGLSLSLWVVGALIAACGVAVGLEYGCMLPRSGGEKVYLEFVYRKPKFLASTLVATQAVLLGFTASNCIVFAQYVFYAFDIEATGFARKALAVALLTAITVVHGCFMQIGIRTQNFLGWIKVGLVALMVCSSIFVVLVRPSGDNSTRSHFPSKSDIWKGTNWSWSIIATSLFKVFYSFAGLNNVNNVMNEVRNPVRTLKSVSITALIMACIMYTLVNIAYFIVVPLFEIKEGRELVAALFFERCFETGIARILLPLSVALSAAGNVMVVTFALARLNQEVARQGFLPYSKLFASSKPFGAPMGGLIIHYIPSLLVITLPPSKEVYSFILEVEGYAGQTLALASSVGLLWLRYRRPELHRPFKAWIGAVLVRIVLCVALLVAPGFPYRSHPTDSSIWHAMYAIVAWSILSFGVIYWYIWIKLIPRLKGYRLQEAVSVLDDGTTVTSLVKVSY